MNAPCSPEALQMLTQYFNGGEAVIRVWNDDSLILGLS